MIARKPRVWYPGAIYHVTARGNRKEAIFRDIVDYRTYLKYLRIVRNRYPFILHSYCLMKNHVHLQLETIHDPLHFIMRDFHSEYAMYFNRRYDLVGHVFQGRYKAQLIESDHYFLKVSQYIHLNPVRANLVEKPEDYIWSSYHSYITGKDNPNVDKQKTLYYFTKDRSRITYQQYVEEHMKENPFSNIQNL
ncbi:transposase [Bacillus smithii]|uniref:transposase n=1 Tax=Bacillus smithii TaxID=1479 RepID=UPI002E1FEADB|nr:transposase [Bacillus smithii]MED4926348.1 transposase [Bacillus smithii]